MSPFSHLSAAAKSYVIAVVIVGGAVLGLSIAALIATDTDARWFVLVLLTLLTSSVTVKVPSVAATLSISEAFVFAAVILFGWPGGTVLASLDGLVISLWLHRRKTQPPYRLLFNATAPALATYLAYWVYAALGAPVVTSPDFHITQILIPICGFAAAYFLANSFLIAAAIALEQHQSALKVWRENFTWLSINYFSGASMAALLVAFGGQGGETAITAIWIVLPLLAITYFTYKSSMERIEDANKHVEQLNTLYLSTVETLAMAIDAKDQITHGHIRRVQTFAVALAKEVGITDQLQIKAIEAAALLHDMGKLAVPEYILNKPGPLTPAEFDRMKLHAAAGADILSAIDFPYPVVPIVRHHHENWDGNGYPAGLKGTDIPIGARVLSVVDCFDALTSDRPYRPRLSDEDALEVVTGRRGSMYDPLIVDAFLRLYEKLRRQPALELSSAMGGSTHLASTTSSPRLAAISASAGESRAMYRLIQRLAAQHSLEGAFGDVVEEVATLIPATAIAIYTPTPDGAELEATHVGGGGSEWLRGRRVRMGERIVGWSANSGRSVINADASGELGELARADSTLARSCMTVPIVVRGERLGVVVAFSAMPSAFRPEDQRIVEALVKHIAPVLQRLTPRRDAEEFRPANDSELAPPAVIGCRCSTSQEPNVENVGRALGIIRRHLGAHAMTQIAIGNDIFTGVRTADADLVDAMAMSLRASLLGLGLIEAPTKVVVAATPKDGTSLEHLLYACRQRLSDLKEGQPRVH